MTILIDYVLVGVIFGDIRMALIISMFNHKGGVSKTTTAFNLGWMLSRKNRRVLLVDCDPQCNLTGMVLGLEDMETSDSVQGRDVHDRPLNIREGLLPAFESRPTPITCVHCVRVPNNDKLFLLPGNIGLAEYEVTLGIAQELSGSVVTLRNLPGSLHHLITLTATALTVDIVIVDMSPSLGAVNQNLFATSDYFIVPMHPDYFSNMAINSLAKVLPKWRKWAVAAGKTAALRDAAYPFPPSHPKYLGYVVQKYRPRNGAPSRAFQTWISQLERSVRETLVPALQEEQMLLDDSTYKVAGLDPCEPILQMSDFNSLIASSQTHQVPIFELSPEQLGQVGNVLNSTRASQERFRELFSVCADKIIVAVDADRNR